MDDMQAQELAIDNLSDFKSRMKIFGNFEDDALIALLANSFKRIAQLIGEYKPDDNLNFVELVFERSRYAYNDSLEYFEDNFQPMILELSLANWSDDDDSSEL